jgi:hypothetical protein
VAIGLAKLFSGSQAQRLVTDLSDIVKLIDDAEALPKKRGPYKKKAA